MATKPCNGVVKGKVIVLKNGAQLPEGTEVLVTPVDDESGSVEALLAVAKRPSRLTAADVAEWEGHINKGQRPVSSSKLRSKKRRA